MSLYYLSHSSEGPHTQIFRRVRIRKRSKPHAATRGESIQCGEAKRPCPQSNYGNLSALYLRGANPFYHLSPLCQTFDCIDLRDLTADYQENNDKHSHIHLLCFPRLWRCSLIPFSSSLRALCSSTMARKCSIFRRSKSSSSFLCQGYKTNTWKANAELPMTKLVTGKSASNNHSCVPR